MGARRGVVAVGVVAALAVGAGTSWGGDAPTPEEAFARAIARARRLLADGQAKQGLAVTKEALEAHARQDYVRAKRAEVEDLVHRLAFRQVCTPPAPQSVVRGKLRRYVPTTGELEIRWEDPDQPHDFEVADGGRLIFPARFRGPYTVEVKGDRYPDRTERSPSMLVGVEDDPKTGRRQAWIASPGVPSYTEGSNVVWMPARLLRLDGEQTTTLYEESSRALPGRAWRFQVKVDTTTLVASLDGKAFARAAKPAGVFGYVSLDLHGTWREISIAGRVEPSWIQSKLDAVVEKARDEFDRGYDPKAHLPPWWFEGAAAREGEPKAPPAGDLPGLGALAAVPRAALPLYAKAAAHVVAKRWTEALAAIDELRKQGVPDRALAAFAAQARRGLGQHEEALAEVDRALAADPAALELVLVRAALLVELDREAELAPTFERAAAAPTAPRLVFELGAMLLLRAERADAARSLCETAARRGHRSPVLDALGRVLVKAAHGPEWTTSFEAKTSNYHVLSDIDAATCREAANLLEEALSVYRTTLGPWRPEPKRLYRVYLFRGEAGFQRYLADLTLVGGRAPEHAAGVYSPILKHLLIWNLPHRAEMMKTVRHEGFHQYLDRLLPAAPVWLDEGMAAYYEGMQKTTVGAIRTDHPRPEYLEALAGRELLPLARFLSLEPDEFYRLGLPAYAQGWLLVHLLRHGKPAHRDVFKRYLAALATKSVAEAGHAVFDPSTVASLDADLAAHLASLSRPR